MAYSDETFLRDALGLAGRAAETGEIPVGAVIVRDGEVLARASNLTEHRTDPTAHAELLAIREACEKTGRRRLSGCTLYVTLEPCPMCAGAIAAARIPRVVFAAKDPRAGAMGSLIDLTALPLESRPEVCSGLLSDESLSLLRGFFEKKRAGAED